MGDVFDAMNRGKQERTAGATPPDPAANSPGKAPALPLDQVPAARTEDRQPALPLDQIPPPGELKDLSASVAPARPDLSHAVSAAQARAQTETAAKAGDTATAIPTTRDPKLNGYSAEVVVHHDRGGVVTEQYRQIRTQLLARARSRRLQTCALTSAAPDEGKTVTTINLGFAFSELRNQRTILVETDLRRPTFDRVLDRKSTQGLLTLLRGQSGQLEDAIQHTVYDNLDIISAGGREAEHSTELLSSPRMAQILDRLKDRYDHIFLDTPPVVTVTDACIVGTLCDATMLVVRLNKTPADIIDRAKRLLRASNCELTGVILTHLEQEPLRYLYRYAYGYSYDYAYDYAKPKKR